MLPPLTSGNLSLTATATEIEPVRPAEISPQLLEAPHPLGTTNALHYKPCPAIDHALACLVTGNADSRSFGLDAHDPWSVTRHTRPSTTGSITPAVWPNVGLFPTAGFDNSVDLLR
jgi:hypothetical protein